MKEQPGEGNRKADRRYREGVRKTVSETSEAERARRATVELSEDDKRAARKAEEQARARARS